MHCKSLKNCSLPFTVHPPAWDCNVASPSFRLREAALKAHIDAIHFCAELGIKQAVFHPGYYNKNANFSRTKAIDHSYTALEQLIREASPYGITIAYENIGTPNSALFTQSEFIHALDGIDDHVQYLIDVGHANINAWDISAAIEKLAPRLCAMHIHDNNGVLDEHKPIFAGTIAWKNVFKAMSLVRNNCDFIMEYAAGTSLSFIAEGKRILEDELL